MRSLPLGALAVVALVITAAAAGAAEQEPYPIWWSPILELESLDDVERRLDRSLWKDDDEGLELQWRAERTVVHDCRSLKRHTLRGKEGYYVSGSGSGVIELHLLSICRAIELLGKARPAARSFVRDFRMDVSAVDILPSPIDGPSFDFFCRQIHANEKGIPWSAFAALDTVEQLGPNKIRVRMFVKISDAELVGRGDFDGNGVEDLMVIVRYWLLERERRDSLLFILTRDGPDVPLKILEPESYRDVHGKCEPSYAFPTYVPADLGRDFLE